MGSLGLPEILFILVLALLIFGPKRLPEIGRTLGKGIAEFRKASNELKRTINAELALDADQQTPHPRRIESPVPSIVQAMTPPAAASAASAASAPTSEASVSPGPWTPHEPPAGTVAQTPPTHRADEMYDPTLPSPVSSTDPIDPS